MTDDLAKLIAFSSIFLKVGKVVQDDAGNWLIVVPVKSEGRGKSMLREIQAVVTAMKYHEASADVELDEEIRRSANGTLEK